MVIRYNIPHLQAPTKRNYKKRVRNKLSVSSRRNVTKVTRENKRFLQSLGFEVLV